MTHDEMIEVIKAHKEGKTVQYKSRSSEKGWVTPACPSNIFPHNFDSYDYRVKPEPREFWLCRGSIDSHENYQFCTLGCVDSKQLCKNAIKVREVIE